MLQLLFSRPGTARTNEDSIKGPCMVQHVAMVESEPLESAVDRAMVVGRKDEGAREGYHEKIEEIFQRLTLTEPPRRMVIKEMEPGAHAHGILANLMRRKSKKRGLSGRFLACRTL